MATKKYRCKVCGYIHEGKTAPESCPVCKAPASEFEEIVEKRGFNKENSTYIFVYTSVIIVIVSLLLSFTSGALKSRQAANMELDKKKQILSSLPAVNLEGADAAALYNTYIKKYIILDANGEVSKEIEDFNYKVSKDEYPLYIAEVEGQTKYIIPLNGAGLWGAIWGYIALNDDKNTVYGVYFSHASETPGLGANIVTPKFRDQFVGKEVMKEGSFASIAVMKAGQTAEGQDQVDAISGGTITSKGVESMLKNCIGNYITFLKKTAQTENVAKEGGNTL
ncbi:MAG: NADH:ubiquinone reductase (Na(+)-transporting) subunit C [Prevotellaceae bacterium]|nr:NADH:ubiquinone reductase (Na(+)-transporting) subunit C [Prevotellaceae bacterium]